MRLIRNVGTNLGDFCADAYRFVSGADIGFVNGGSIRADIPSGDGFTMFADNKFIVEDFMIDNQVLMTYIKKTLGGVISASYADPYGRGRITLK